MKFFMCDCELLLKAGWSLVQHQFSMFFLLYTPQMMIGLEFSLF